MSDRMQILLIGISSLVIGLAMVPVFFNLLQSRSWLDTLGKGSMMILLAGCLVNVALACRALGLGEDAACDYYRLQQICSTWTFAAGGGLYAVWRGIWNARRLNAFSYGFYWRKERAKQ